jgi:hypothetical protein
MSRFVVAPDADGCVPVRAWNPPADVAAELVDDGARFFAFDGAARVAIIGGHLLARATALFGKPTVDYCRFTYVLRDSVGGAIISVGLHVDGPDSSVAFAGKGADLDASVDALEAELASAKPANCSVDIACNGFDIKLGRRAGKAFLKIWVE